MKSKSGTRSVRAILLAGGRGTRLAPYTTVLPKPLMPVGDVPIAEILVRQLKRAGVRQITFSVGYLSSLIRAYFGDGKRFGVSIDYSEETRPFGTAGPIGLIKGLNDTFLVLNGDILTTLDFRAMIRAHRAAGSIATVGVYDKKVKIDLGILELDRRGAIQKYVEKPTFSYPVSIGAYVFDPAVLKYLPKGRRFDLPDLVRALLHKRLSVGTFACRGIWLDIGRPEDYAQATEIFQRRRREFGL